jgi:RNA polymerase sigma-70 factor (ECF subfamily)
MTDPGRLPQSPVEERTPGRSLPAFREIYEAHAGYVWNTLRRLGVREGDLEDVVHEVFLAVYKRLGDYDPAKPLRPWLFGFSFRTASDYRSRARHRREVAEAEMEVADEAPAADEQVEAQRRRALVNAALEAIELGRRAVFIMHEIDGAPIPEVASALGIPLNTAYSRLRLAREEFGAAVRRLQAKKGGVR